MATIADISPGQSSATDIHRLLADPGIVDAIQDGVRTAAANTERHMMAMPDLRLPRTAEEKRHNFEGWLAHYRDELNHSLSSELKSRLNELSHGFGKLEGITRTLNEMVWPLVETELRARGERFLRHYAIQGLALNWLMRFVGEGIIVGAVDEVGPFWRVSLLNRRNRIPLSSLTLDAEGNVLTTADAVKTAYAGRR